MRPLLTLCHPDPAGALKGRKPRKDHLSLARKGGRVVRSTKALFASLFFLLAGAAFGADPSIETLSAKAVNRQVSVRFTMAHAFEREQTIQGLQSGAPTTLNYVVEIFRDRPRWFDEGIGRSRIEVVATFNSLTREYLLNYRRDHKLVRSETFTDLAALQRAMSTIDEPNLFDIGKRPPYKLKVRVKADLMRGWLLYFIPWEFSTRWRDVRVAAMPETAR